MRTKKQARDRVDQLLAQFERKVKAETALRHIGDAQGLTHQATLVLGRAGRMPRTLVKRLRVASVGLAAVHEELHALVEQLPPRER